MTPRSRPAGTTGAASRVELEAPDESAAAHGPSRSVGCAAMACSRCSKKRPTWPRAPSVRRRSVRRARRSRRGRPADFRRTCCRDRRTKIVPATSSLTSAAPIGTPPPSALPTETRCGFRPRVIEVERSSRCGPSPLCTSSAISRAPLCPAGLADGGGERRRERPDAAFALNRFGDDRGRARRDRGQRVPTGSLAGTKRTPGSSG